MIVAATCRRVGLFLAAAVLLLCASAVAQARDIRIEFLQADISPKTVQFLSGIWCRNVDKIVHLKVSVNWPSDSRDEESDGYKRLIFWTKQAEYLFPDGSYQYLHGDYVVDGYFIARSGGFHQGMQSMAFDRIDDAKVLLNPAVREVQTQKAGCR